MDPVMDPNAAYGKPDKLLLSVYGVCAGQFILALYYVSVYRQPATRLDLALVGLSAVCGILLSGIFRRSYNKMIQREKADKQNPKVKL